MFKRTKIAKILAIFALGSLVGAVITLLLAPKSGRETRTQIKAKGLHWLDRLKSVWGRKTGGKRLSNWGNYPKVAVKLYEFEDLGTLRKLVTATQNVIPRGNGRCYGDSALAPQVISTLSYNKFLAFDEQQGTIRCQSGVILADILDVIVPKGWFLPVTPGTKLISVGGAIASDVHGKSQHKAGNFSDHVLELELMLGDGSIVTCSAEKNADLYWTTCGGMGLTGVILNATLRLIPIETAYIRQDVIKAKNLDELMDLFEQSEDWTYSMAWIDCLTTGDSMGRGILMRGEHARLSDLEKEAHKQNPLAPKPKRKLNVPFNFPNLVLNSLTMKLFNVLYYYKQLSRQVTSIVDYDTFFYPLDSIANWNRIYGRRGFTQYQFILPKQHSREGMRKILQKISGRGMGSFLAVLKLYGHQKGYIPFAMEGYSLALDFPITADLFQFLDELDEIVLANGGRLYLTKDVRMDKKMFMQSYPKAEDFIEKIQDLNHGTKFRSFQSDRVGLTA